MFAGRAERATAYSFGYGVRKTDADKTDKNGKKPMSGFG